MTWNFPAPSTLNAKCDNDWEQIMPLILWLLGVPLSVVLVLWLMGVV